MPFFSVIVPNYNHADYLTERIDSIINQSFQDFELILLDDCSTDNSRDVLSQYSNHPKVKHYVVNDQNSGSTFKQWDKGISLSQGEYVWIAESDDVADPLFLETVSSCIRDQHNVGLLFTKSRLIDNRGVVYYEPDGDMNEFCVRYTGEEFIKRKLICANAIWNASMMVFEKSIYKQIDIARYVTLKYCGDWYFYILLSEQTNVLEINKVLNEFRVHPRNVSINAKKNGLSFLEGIDVYSYSKKYLSFVEKAKADYCWAKKLYKSIRQYQFSNELIKDISEQLMKDNRSIYFLYKLYGLLKD